MRVELVGTGGAGGWPQPGCGCASCRAAGATGAAAGAGGHRRPLDIAVDGQRLDLGAGPVSLASSLLVVPTLDELPPAPVPCYHTVLLGCPNPRGFGAALAELRRRGAAGPATRVVAIGVSHGCPPPAELAALLRALGAELGVDGQLIDPDVPQSGPSRAVWAAPGAAHQAPPSPRTLLTGGARSGKSARAELLVSGEPEVLYLATGPSPGSGDPDWADRVAAHRRRRPPHWETVESTDLLPHLQAPGPALLIDCLSLWLAAHLDDQAAADAVVGAWRSATRRVVAVTSEVGDGVHPETALGRRYRDQLGALNTRIAAESDEVWLLTAGLGQRLR